MNMYRIMYTKTFKWKFDASIYRSFGQSQRNALPIPEKNEKETRTSNLKKYWFDRYINYMKNYERIMEKNFPRTMKVYRIFSVGARELLTDMKKYISIMKKLNKEGPEALTLDELQLKHTLPKDLIKVSPVLLLSAVPFTNYIIFPLGYLFPHKFLTSQFWTLQQRFEFLLKEQKKRLKYNRPLFRCMQAELDGIKNDSLRKKWGDVVACLGSGTHPSTNDILACKELFIDAPYSIRHLRRKHVNQLLGIHGISNWRIFKRQKLVDRGYLLKQMDYAIIRDGGVTKLSNESIRWALSFRGVNPANMSIESMQAWLEQWLIISHNVDRNSVSLLLHCPILLAYNHSTNWTLIYS